MRLPHFEYVKPATLEEGLKVLHQSGNKARILAGGTDLLVNMKYRVVRPEIVMGIKSLPELCTVSSGSNGSVTIGSCVTLTDLAKNSLIAENYPALKLATTSIASKHIRNMGTIGGNVCLTTRCWYYNQSKLWRDGREVCHKAGGTVCHAIKGSTRCHAINNSDTIPVLIVLNATMVLKKKGSERLIPSKEFFRDDGIRYTVLEPDEILTALLLPESSGDSYITFIKVCSRKGLDFAWGSIAASVTGSNGKCTQASLVLSSIASAPLVLKKTSQVIIEGGLSEQSIEKAVETARSELGILTNLFTSAGYKRDLSQVLVKRALGEFQGQMKKKRRTKA